MCCDRKYNCSKCNYSGEYRKKLNCIFLNIGDKNDDKNK
jgi:hypothetical protein